MNEFTLGPIETDEPLNGDEKRAMKTARDFLGGLVPSAGRRISIFRSRPSWIPGGGGWLETVDFSDDSNDFSMEWLRETYGGGTYVLKVLDEKGKFMAAQTVKIAGDPIHQGRRLSQLEAEAKIIPPPPPPAKDSETAELIKALLANSSKAQRDSFDLLVSLWTNQAKPQGQPSSLDDMAKMIKFVDEIRGGQAPAEDGTMMGMMGLLSQFMQSKQATAPIQPVQPTRSPMRFAAPPSMPHTQNMIPIRNPVPASMPQASPVPEPQSSPVLGSMPQVSPAPAPIAQTEKKEFEIDDLEFHGDEQQEEQEGDIADDIAEWPVDEIVQLIADVMAKLPESKTLQLMERMKTS